MSTEDRRDLECAAVEAYLDAGRCQHDLRSLRSVPGEFAASPERTLTLALPKTGLLRVPGELYLADIGIPPEAYHQLSALSVCEVLEAVRQAPRQLRFCVMMLSCYWPPTTPGRNTRALTAY